MASSEKVLIMMDPRLKGVPYVLTFVFAEKTTGKTNGTWTVGVQSI